VGNILIENVILIHSLSHTLSLRYIINVQAMDVLKLIVKTFYHSDAFSLEERTTTAIKAAQKPIAAHISLLNPDRCLTWTQHLSI